MTKDSKELAVAALRHGTVIDHIPAEALFKAVKILGIEKMTTAVTIGNNLSSHRLGKKGIIKVADVEFDDDVLNRIALIAPHAKINIIRDYEVAKKFPISLPDEIRGIVRCGNPKCITNNEPMRTRFEVIDREDVTIRCCYCGQCVKSGDAIID
ncbi:MAG: aspartate carbamoyltransferase regulatory subunit [Bacteroides sp.]|nr:aspartate carbamoyltransferase regulatory subunit [Bacteroides sp.]MDE6051915.1 aspartate carbamoyltransferase regulatory subunit [Paramuribaculum sp.]MBD5297505.1 aspartate carbamoyltransferase regulatory subunit [Bacteroides sp.]MBD5297661.1 aspartate carbamoyltransferase regulatory subunit [Bacteroides sp.]MBD5320230.1 aspartate carbamoyltransferase regulatory subunit [Bacteroides sp.]